MVKGLNFCYILLDLISGKEKDYHVSDMNPFVFAPALVDPLDIACRDYMEYSVSKILQHRSNSSMKYEVSWLNHLPESNTWDRIKICGRVVPSMFIWPITYYA